MTDFHLNDFKVNSCIKPVQFIIIIIIIIIIILLLGATKFFVLIYVFGSLIFLVFCVTVVFFVN